MTRAGAPLDALLRHLYFRNPGPRLRAFLVA